MFNENVIKSLVQTIKENNGIGEKDKLASIVKKKFHLVQDRKIFYGDHFAIRFGMNRKNDKKNISNTVLALSKIKSYDRRPLLFCIVTRSLNHILMINTTFLKKVSHSSKELRVDNIKGSINCSDIMQSYNGLENSPENFKQLFAYHNEISFDENLERLVEATNGIVGTIKPFIVDTSKSIQIYKSVERSINFLKSENYIELKNDLTKRVEMVKGEIAIAALIDNVKLRGTIIEYLITDNGSNLKNAIISFFTNGTPLPDFTVKDGLGDYVKSYPYYETATDIKTKVLWLDGNPKAYNIDKMLEYLSHNNTVFLFFFVGIKEDSSIIVRLCSVFDKRLIQATNIEHHWAGRNTRGGTQFIGTVLKDILLNPEDQSIIDKQEAIDFLKRLIELN